MLTIDVAPSCALVESGVDEQTDAVETTRKFGCVA